MRLGNSRQDDFEINVISLIDVMLTLLMFFAVMVSGVGDPLKMAGGIGQALVCTASGLCVAIPAYFFHRYFRGLVQDYVVSMEQQVILLMDELAAQADPLVAPAPVAAAPSPAPPRPSRARATAPTPSAID